MQVVHLICRKGIGGVQSQFTVYEQFIRQQGRDNFRIVEPCSRGTVMGYLVLLRELLFIVTRARSSKTIFHVYNGLVSIRYLLLFFFVKPRNLVFHERGNAWNVAPGKEWVVRVNARLARRILCNSRATRTLLNKVFNVPENKMEVLYNGVFDRDRLSPLSEVADPGDSLHVGYVGRLEPHKGVHVLIQAMAKLPSDRYRLTVVGDGSQRQDLQTLAQDLGVDAIFTGRLDDPGSVMREMDIVIVPSIREPLGNVIIEAGSLGRFVIASKVDGIAEIIKDGESGVLLVPDEDIPEKLKRYRIPIPRFVVDPDSQQLNPAKQLGVDELARVIEHYAGDETARTAMAQALYYSVHDRFSVQRYSDQLDRFYRELVPSQA